MAEDDFGRAREAYREIVRGDAPVPNDFDQYAWLSLFTGDLDDDAIAAAQQASMVTKGQTYSYLHTLACLHAQRGETAEARQELLDAMSSSNLEEPDAGIWLGFGLIDEQYGVKDAAIAAYRRVLQLDAPAARVNLANRSPAGSPVLARMRLQALHAD